MDNNDRGTGTVVIIVLAVIASFLIYRSFSVISAGGFERGKEIISAAYEQAQNLAVKIYLPQVFYDADDPGSGDFIEQVVQTAKEQIPGMGVGEKKKVNDEQVIEDDSTKKAIRDENAKAIQTKMTDENQEKAKQDEQKKKEEEQKKQQEEAAKAKEEEAKAASSINIVNPIPIDQLRNFDFLVNNYFVVDKNTTAEKSQINADEFWANDMKIAKDQSVPQILIYHTHSQEAFADSTPGDPDTTVVGLGNRLTSILQDTYGYQVIHLTNTFDLVDGKENRSKAYNYALPVVEQTLQDNPSIEVVIDLHRDGVDDSKHLVTEIDGKPTAQIMLFNGLSRTRMNGDNPSLPNPYIKDNLAFSFQLEYLANQCYPDFTRCIYLKGLRYNLHVRPRSILLEVGAQTNTLEEVRNAMEPFAKVLNSVLEGTNKTIQ